MSKELIVLPGVSVSCALVSNLSLAEWGKNQAKYPKSGNASSLKWLLADASSGQKGSAFITYVTEQAKSQAKKFCLHYSKTYLNNTVDGSAVDTIISQHPLSSDGLNKLQNQSANQVAGLSDIKLGIINTEIETWFNILRKALVRHWLTHVRSAGITLPTRREDDSVKKSANVACAVHIQDNGTWGRLGNMYTSAPNASHANHAEMQWKAAHGEALAPKLATVTQVEFHISKQPCGENCATKLIEYWASLNTQVAGFIVTYADDDGAAHQYRLFDDAIIRLA